MPKRIVFTALSGLNFKWVKMDYLSLQRDADQYYQIVSNVKYAIYGSKLCILCD